MTTPRLKQSVAIEWADLTRGAPMQFLRTNAKKFSPLLPPNCLSHVSVVVVGAKRMSDLHARFSNDPSATDVLTFELGHDSNGRVTSGEIVVCSAVARKSARILRKPVSHELLLYVLHGMLHLCGMDDLDPLAYRLIHEAEDRILRKIGIGNVFASDTMPRRIHARLPK